jgi:chromosomal replication initiation ATPase DnaA
MTPREQRLAIIVRVAEAHGVTLGDVLGYSRRAYIVAARRAAMHALRDECGYSLCQIGRLLGRHHTTVMHALRVAA